jgi:hypothetical protein
MAVSREIRGSQEDAQNRRDIPRMIELGGKSIAFPSRLIFAPAAVQSENALSPKAGAFTDAAKVQSPFHLE